MTVPGEDNTSPAARWRPETSTIISALIVAGIGVFLLVEAWDYRRGQLTQMGPGFFPLILSACMLGLSVLILLEKRVEVMLPLERGMVRPILFVPASLLSFALLIQPMGLLPASAALVAISCAADSSMRLWQAALLTAFIPIMLVAIFIYGIGLTIPIFRW